MRISRITVRAPEHAPESPPIITSICDRGTEVAVLNSNRGAFDMMVVFEAGEMGFLRVPPPSRLAVVE